MTLRHMRILVAVFQQGSVTKAAQALHLAQPSVSLALRELEDYYGVALFTRTGRQLLPTVCGQSFYDYAVHVVSLVDEMETQMRNWDTLGTMRIGSTITIGTHLLPGLVRQLQAEFPDLKIEVKVCRASQVEQLILDNDIDLGLMEMQPEHPKLYAEPFLHDELQAIVPAAACARRKGERHLRGIGGLSVPDARTGQRRTKDRRGMSGAEPSALPPRVGEREHTGHRQRRRRGTWRCGAPAAPGRAGRAGGPRRHAAVPRTVLQTPVWGLS